MNTYALSRAARASLCIALFVCLGCNDLQPQDHAMYSAVLGRDIDRIAALHGDGYDIDRRITFDGWTPLTLAAGGGDLRLVEYLLSLGAQVDHPKGSAWRASDRTALSFAAAGDVEISRALLQAGADPDARDVSGNTPLHEAATAASLETLVVLLDEGADVNATNNLGATPLFYAGQATAPGALDCVRELLARGADPFVRTKRGQDAIDWARDGRVVELIQAAQARQPRSPS